MATHDEGANADGGDGAAAPPSRVAAPAPTPPLFGRRATAVLLAVVAAVLALGAAGVAAAMAWVRTPYVTTQYAHVDQPVPFSHKLHVTGFEIPCLYCHASADRARSAGMPSTRSCVPCHNETWYESPWFEPVRASLATGRPIPWNRVHDLADHVYFNHAVHVQRDVPCAACHGEVEQMNVVRQVAPLTMQWCLDCHRDPGPYVRPIPTSTVTQAPGRPWPAPADVPDSLALVVARLTTCTACHR